MPAQGGIDVAAANRSAAAFGRALDLQAAELVKAGLFAGGRDLQFRIEGYSNNPRRIDTGETRDGWNLAVNQATGRAVGTTSAAPPRGGVGEVATSGHRTVGTMLNLAPQATWVEYGTPTMRPGYHVRDSQRVVDAMAGQMSDPCMAAAWSAA